MQRKSLEAARKEQKQGVDRWKWKEVLSSRWEHHGCIPCCTQPAHHPIMEACPSVNRNQRLSKAEKGGLATSQRGFSGSPRRLTTIHNTSRTILGSEIHHEHQHRV